MDRAYHQHLAADGVLRLDPGQKIGCNIGVGTQRQLNLALYVALRQHGRNHIDAVGRDFTRHMGVIGTQVILLRMRRIQIRPGLQKKFDNANVAGYVVVAQRFDVVEVLVVAEDALRQGLKQTALKIAAGAWPLQTERRDDCEM